MRREIDKPRLESRLGLPEHGKGVDVCFFTPSDYKVAKGYERIVYGERGAYVEFSKDQVAWESFTCTRKGIGWFNKWYSPDGIMLYDQRARVEYADYVVGMVYVDPYKVKIKFNKQGVRNEE